MVIASRWCCIRILDDVDFFEGLSAYPGNTKGIVKIVNTGMPLIDPLVEKPMEELFKNPPKKKQEAEKKENKSVTDMVAYVLYVFDKVGTETEKKTARAVISKFKAYAGKDTNQKCGT